MRRWILFFSLFLNASLHATTFYVTTTGNDSNPCTLASPCATPTHADSIASAGDTVNVAAGTYSYGASAATFSMGGGSGTPITITCATRGACKITNTVTGNTTVVYLHAANLVFDGFEVTNSGAGNNLGIYVDVSNVSITRNTIHDIQTDCGSNGGGGIQIAVANLTNIVIDSNQIYNISYSGTTPKCPSTTVQTDGILAEQTGFTTTTSITNNLVYNTSGGWGIGTSTNALIADNTVFNTVNGGIVINNAPSGTIVENNIIVYTGILASDSAFYGGACAIQNGTSSTTTYGHNELSNNHGGNYGTGFGCSGSGLNTGDIAVDPAGGTIFVNWQQNGSGDYHEKSGSPTIGAGTTVALNHDFDGNPRPGAAGYDMGAFQFSNTWHIRDDGGDMNRCDGHTNAPDPGSGTNQPCALFNPMFLMAVGSSQVWRADFLGGDTVEFDLDASGNPGVYPIGQHNSISGRGVDWTAYGIDTSDCNGTPAFNCHMPALPSGTSGAHTKWLAACSPNCLNGAGNWTGANVPTLAAVNGAYNVLSVQGTQYFDVLGMNITQYTTCTTAAPSGAGHCAVGDDFAAHGIQIEDTVNQGPSNGTIQQVAVYGISNQGVKGSFLNRAPTDTMLFDHLFIFGNGMSGFDSDGGGCGTSCESQGTVTLQNSNVMFNGCVAVLPLNPTINAYGFPSSGVNYCYAQTTGGYGDGIVFIAAQNVTFNLTNNKASWNTQDGHDLLHLGDDQSHTQFLNVTNSESRGNMGQAYKIGGNTTSTIFNNVGVVNCEEMGIGTAAEFTGFPSGWNAGLQPSSDADNCRASDNWALLVSDGRTQTVVHNTTAGYNEVMYDIQCAGTCVAGTDNVIFQDNITIGYIRPSNGLLPSGIGFVGGVSNPFANTGSAIDHNSYWQLRGGSCQQVSQETNQTCTDPQLASQSNIDTFDPHMVNTSSPAYHSGVTAGLSTDAVGNPWNIPPSRGAFEFTGGAPTVAQPTALPVAGSYSSAQSVALSTVTGGASIIYTTDSTTPTVTALTCTITNGTLYTAPVTISTTTTLNAIGCQTGSNASSEFSGLYIISLPVNGAITGHAVITGNAIFKN